MSSVSCVTGTTSTVTATTAVRHRHHSRRHRSGRSHRSRHRDDNGEIEQQEYIPTRDAASCVAAPPPCFAQPQSHEHASPPCQIVTAASNIPAASDDESRGFALARRIFCISTLLLMCTLSLYFVAHRHEPSYGAHRWWTARVAHTVVSEHILHKDPARALLLVEDIQSNNGELSAHVLQYRGGDHGSRPYNVRLLHTLDASQYVSHEQFYEAAIAEIRREYAPQYHVLYVTGAVNRADIVVRAIATKIPAGDDALLTSHVITERDLAVLHWIGAQQHTQGDGIIRLDGNGAAYIAFRSGAWSTTSGSGNNAASAPLTWQDVSHLRSLTEQTPSPATSAGMYPNDHSGSTHTHAVYAMYARSPLDLTGHMATPLGAGMSLHSILHDTNAVCTTHYGFQFDDCLQAYINTLPSAQTLTATQHKPQYGEMMSLIFQIDVQGSTRAALENMDTQLYGGAWMRGAPLTLDEMNARARVKCARIEEDDMLMLGTCHDAAKFYATMKQSLHVPIHAKLVLGRLPNTTWIQGAAMVHLQGESTMQLHSGTTM